MLPGERFQRVSQMVSILVKCIYIYICLHLKSVAQHIASVQLISLRVADDLVMHHTQSKKVTRRKGTPSKSCQFLHAYYQVHIKCLSIV